MNTPKKTKAPKRYGRKKPARSHPGAPDGHYLGGLWFAPHHARILGIITSEWSRVEETMIALFDCLLGSHEGSPTRQIYRSILSPSVRIKMMRAALEESAINKHRGQHWDAIIDGFATLTARRNAYVHGLWEVYAGEEFTTTPDPKTAQVYLRPTSIEEVNELADARRVEFKELDDFAQDLGAFNRRAEKFAREQPSIDEEVEREQASPKKPAPQE